MLEKAGFIFCSLTPQYNFPTASSPFTRMLDIMLFRKHQCLIENTNSQGLRHNNLLTNVNANRSVTLNYCIERIILKVCIDF